VIGLSGWFVVGFWLVFGLFLVCFVKSFFSKKKKKKKKEDKDRFYSNPYMSEKINRVRFFSYSDSKDLTWLIDISTASDFYLIFG